MQIKCALHNRHSGFIKSNRCRCAVHIPLLLVAHAGMLILPFGANEEEIKCPPSTLELGNPTGGTFFG